MCVVKTPKIPKNDASAKPPEPTIIRNPFLDGLDPATKALRRGRSSLRIERGSGLNGSGPTAPPIMGSAPNTPPTRMPTYGSGGWRGGFNGLYVGSPRSY